MLTLSMDIIFLEILLRLPTKPLIRFKCVSKYFKSTISSQEFANFYVRDHFLSSSSNNLLILPENRRYIVCYDINSRPPFPATIAYDWDARGSISVVGSSNGLLCLFTCSVDNYFSVLNPTTRLYKYIRTVIKGGPGHSFGFAFDHENLDYKIVVVYGCIESRITKIYSLNTNSWRRVDTYSPTDSIQETDCGALINDHLLHWMFSNPTLRKHRIGCFNVCKNKWVDDVLLPYYYYDHNHNKSLLTVGVFDGCLFSSFENQVESCFEVWVMKEYGVQDSWFKLLSIPVSDDLVGGVVPLACRVSSGDILLRHRGKSRLFWYNRMVGEMTEAKFHRTPNFSDLQACMCSSSLVDFPGGVLFEYA